MPPTFPERDARLWNAGRERFLTDAETGQRLSAECTRAHRSVVREIARWPALLSPWLPAGTRRATRLPPLAPDCAPDGREAVDTLRIEGIADRATLASPPGSTRGLRLQVRALGSAAPVQWLLDGRAIARTESARAFEHDYAGIGHGEHVLTALADSGAWAQVRFRVADMDGAARQVLAGDAGAGD